MVFGLLEVTEVTIIIGVDQAIIDRMARTMKNLETKISPLNVFDDRYYPPSSEPADRVLSYFLVMVAMDHRLSRPGRSYQAIIDGVEYRGADLLYRLGRIKYEEDPDFFTARRLANVEMEEVAKWLSAGQASPPDLETRVMLLRDLGEKLDRLYGGNPINLLELAGNRLRGSLDKPGLLDLLKVFRAYEDPVEKKALLLAKFLTRRGLISPHDGAGIPVDNHLTRIAYRTGLVMVSGTMWAKIRDGLEVSREEDVLLRMVVKHGYEEVAKRSGLDPFLLDDFLWVHGRNICLRDSVPSCDKCVFKGFCRARKNKSFMVTEHFYYNTWYY